MQSSNLIKQEKVAGAVHLHRLSHESFSEHFTNEHEPHFKVSWGQMEQIYTFIYDLQITFF